MAGRTSKVLLKEPMEATFQRRRQLSLLSMVLLVSAILTLGYYGKVISLPAEQKVYKFLTSSHPSFLDPVNVDTQLQPIRYLPIDKAHRRGKVHTGVWIHVTSADHKVLLLKRAKHLVTCPGAWGMVGEHTNGDESAIETTKRGLVEELWGGKDRSDRDVMYYQSLTEHPVYYFREYASGRVDRQVTYIYEAHFRHPSDQIQLILDDEVADHQWITLEDYRERLYAENATKVFCHPTVLESRRLGLKKLLQFYNKVSE